MNFHLKNIWIGIHSLLKLIVTRRSADVIWFILRLLRHCGPCRYECHKL